MELTCTVKTYLFQIGKHKLINRTNREGRVTYKNDLELIKGKEFDDFLSGKQKDELEEKVIRALEKLAGDCRKLLKLYYYNEYDMNSIARELQYKNADTAKSKKTLCMKKLIAELNKLTSISIL